jgi:PGF-pre-PGF domain-containing protein
VLEPGKAAVATFKKFNDLHIKEVYITLNNKSADAQITVKEANVPLGAIAPTDGGKGKVIDYLQISRSNIPVDSLEKVTFKFTVNKTELSRLNYTNYDVRLVRYLETEKIWQKLNTSFVREDANYSYYSADSPGFSTFAVITEQGAAAPQAAVNKANTTTTAVKNTTTNKSGAADTSGTSGTAANSTKDGTDQPSAATGMAILDLPKNPLSVGIIIFVLVVAIIIVVVKTTGGRSVEIR